MATLPYNPTVALKSSLHNDLVYILQPKEGGDDFSLLSVNASSSLSTSSLSTEVVTEKVPFAGSDSSFTALINGQDEIYAFAGECSRGSDGTKVWTLTSTESQKAGQWKEQGITTKGIDNTDSVGSANYLASGMAFSGVVNGSTALYVFGGLCPNSSEQTTDTWQASAEYSNTMLALKEAKDPGDYELSTVYSRGPPIPEAGFTVTPLAPTFSNTSGGDVTQQQNFVLLGGQTQSAFINMSQAALFSLPERSWSFLPIDAPSTASQSDEDTDLVDPRSGHTAVLSEDGKQVVVYGGWVGDVSTPADPQLAVLEVGDGYGGSGDWRWTVPKQEGTAPNVAGLYGHGAAILPGNVLMLTGGYTIPTSSSRRVKRQTPASNSDTHFFNVTSGSWITEYKNPTPNLENADKSGTTKTSKKVGLGAGLGIGLAVLLALIVVAIFIWRRKKKNSKNIGEKDLQALSLGDQRMVSANLGSDGRTGGRLSQENYPWAPLRHGEESLPVHGRGSEAERTGLLVEIPSPTRGLRRSLHSRPQTWMEDRYSHAGVIHPIDEREEYEPEQHNIPRKPVNAGRIKVINEEDNHLLATAPVLDPFADPPSPSRERHLLDGSRTPSPVSPMRESQSAHSRELEMAGWEQDWAAASQAPATGRISPDKSDRTSSTLSNQSSVSMVSALSYQQPPNSGSSGSMTRSISQRSAALFSSRPLSSNMTSIPLDSQPSPPSETAPSRRPLSFGHRTAADGNAATTQASSFPQLQSEGQALLASRSAALEPGPSSPSKQPRPRTWMGSVRRALTGASSTASPYRSPDLFPDEEDRGDDSIGGEAAAATAAAAGGAYLYDSRTGRSSPTRRPGHAYSHSGGSSYSPQRSASTGTALWRRQQGARDWGVAGGSGGGSSSGGNGNREEQPNSGRTESFGGGGRNSRMSLAPTTTSSAASGHGDEDDWDVESAVESRVVQMMFTVPKEKLRVVNRGPDGDGISVRSQEGVVVEDSSAASDRSQSLVSRDGRLMPAEVGRSASGKGRERV